MKELIGLLDRRTFGTASVVVALFIVVLSLLLFITKSHALDLLDKVYNISGHIEARVREDLAENYTRTFVFDDFHSDPINRVVPQTLLFAVSKGQSAHILLTSDVKHAGAKPIRIEVLVDGTTPLQFLAGTFIIVPFPHDKPGIYEELETKKITQEESLPQNFHGLTVQVQPHPGDKALIVINALVSVGREKPEL